MAKKQKLAARARCQCGWLYQEPLEFGVGEAFALLGVAVGSHLLGRCTSRPRDAVIVDLATGQTIEFDVELFPSELVVTPFLGGLEFMMRRGE